MEKFKRIVRSGALYTTLISCLFYPLAALSGNAGFVMSAKRFFTILLFSFIIALTQAFVSAFNFKKIFNFLIYYFVLLLSFFFIFVFGGGIALNGAGTVFAIVIIYTALFALVAGVTALVRRTLVPVKKKEALKNQPQKYKHRFED